MRLDHEFLNANHLDIQLATSNHVVHVGLKCHLENELSLCGDSVFYRMNRFTPLGFTQHEASVLQDAYDAVTKADMWEYLRLPTTPGKDGFMFNADVELTAINYEMTYTGHSGASYAWTMRQMEFIAKQGWEGYATKLRAERAAGAAGAAPASLACTCRREKGYTTGWCGVAGGGVPACDH